MKNAYNYIQTGIVRNDDDDIALISCCDDDNSMKAIACVRSSVRVFLFNCTSTVRWGYGMLLLLLLLLLRT